MANTTEQLLGLLANAVDANDFLTYGNLVNNNQTLVQNFDSDFWLETFGGGSRGGISFWVNTPNRRLTLGDISLLSSEHEDLFQMGLSRTDLEVSDAQNVIDFIRDTFGEYSGNDLNIRQTRVTDIIRVATQRGVNVN